MKIFVIGMWHLGCVNAVGLQKLGHKVTCFDFDLNTLYKLKHGIMPIHESGIKKEFAKGKIKCVDDIKYAKNKDFIFITYDIGANNVTLDIIDRIIDEIKPFINRKQIIVVRSQVTIGVCEKIAKETGCKVCYMPENLRLGTALKDFFNPGWLVFGLSDISLKPRIQKLFSKIKAKKIFLGLKEAEMVKLTMNGYLATLISFSGEISNICEYYNINAQDVFSTVKLDKRISPFAPINPGLGFSGGTIDTDLKSLILLRPATRVLPAVRMFNEERKYYVLDKLTSLLGTLNNKTIVFLGVTYKKDTDTLRNSPVVPLVNEMKNFYVTIKAYDPLVKSGIDNVQFVDLKDIKDADAIVVMTDYDEFKKLDFSKFNVVIDTKNVVPKSVKHFSMGVNYK